MAEAKANIEARPAPGRDSWVSVEKKCRGVDVTVGNSSVHFWDGNSSNADVAGENKENATVFQREVPGPTAPGKGFSTNRQERVKTEHIDLSPEEAKETDHLRVAIREGETNSEIQQGYAKVKHEAGRALEKAADKV